MRMKVGRKTFNVYATDFETHSDNDLIEEYQKNPKSVSTGVWLWYLIDENSKWDTEGAYGYNLDTYLERLKEISKPNTNKHRPGNVLIYDYNLSFEWSFLVYKLIEQGYKYKTKIEDHDEKVYNLITTRSMSSVWQINLKINKGKSIIIFRDLAKIAGGGSLRSLAKSYDLETQKGDIDYSLNRRTEGYIPTSDELVYCFKDCRIIIDILMHPKIQNDKIFWKSISAASYSVATGIKYAYPKAFRPVECYRKRYPILSLEESIFLREGYGGGIAYCVPRWQYKEIVEGRKYLKYISHGILHIDMHNAHPSAMYSKEFPLGRGIHFTFNKKLKLSAYKGFIYSNRISCCKCLVSFTGVKVHSVIKLIGLNQGYNIELVLWDFEILTMIKAYENLEVTIIDGYSYRKDKLPFAGFFKENYDIRKEAKKNKDAYEINHRKLLNNSFYGKLNEKGHDLIFKPVINDEGMSATIPEAVVDAPYMGKWTYLPAGTAVPAYTRCWLIDTALGYIDGIQDPKFKDLYKYILYFDTDSIFFIANELTEAYIKTLPMDDDLCNWGFEELSSRGIFACPKRYKLESDNKTIAHLAGFNIDTKTESYDKIDVIRNERYINRAYRIKGGTLITKQLKRLDVDKKYLMIYQENYAREN